MMFKACITVIVTYFVVAGVNVSMNTSDNLPKNCYLITTIIAETLMMLWILNEVMFK